ncbi:MAG: DEAD/DEAH box helicase [Promethearchaeota archaeon]|nr:MAG: DEAD/DEAH box helicase [Candidatus Lokiarchaeota archaeon]
MTIPSKHYFIVIDKDRKEKKELAFHVNFFYLKSFKDENHTFKYVREPFFRGLVIFGLDIKNKMRPLKFSKIEKDYTMIPVNPRLFKKFVFAKENEFIAFSAKTDQSEFAPILEMLQNFQYNKNKIITLTFCESCLDKKRFNLLNKKAQVISFKNQIICSECALDVVLNNIKMTGLIPSETKISPKLKNFFKHLILKFRNVSKVLSAFKSDFNPVLNKDITLYDVEKTPAISKKYLNYKVSKLDIPLAFKKILESIHISTLLPIQAISIEKGLLSDYNDQLLMAPTSGGKTLVGELAGISKLLKNKNLKMLYLVPIVALANIRTDEFKTKYKPLNIKIVKKVGESLLEKKEEDIGEDLFDAHIIIATYEAIDFILRSGNKDQIGAIGTIIVDEIQTLIDPDRGYLLDGFIARLKVLYKEAQFLYLSATVGEPELLARKLGCTLIRYNNRPVPIERHLLINLTENIKHKNIAKLVRAAFSQKSKFGFKGQSIVFTNTRKKCDALTAYLQNKGINMRSYHSGLTNEERKLIEIEFKSQRIAGVVATAALAAGVDLAASQVLFESLAMGIHWLTVAEFEQMLGRAGRLKKHELGLAYLLVQPGKIYSPKMTDTEENIAIKLLNGKIKDFELEPDENRSLTELLAFISMFNKGIEFEKIIEYYDFLINNHYNIDDFVKKLNHLRLVRIKENLIHKPTHTGQSISKSFLYIDEGLEIIEKLQKNEVNNIIELALELKPIKNVYLSKKVVAELSRNINMRYMSNNFFSASVISLMNAEYVRTRKSFSRDFIELIMRWINDIYNCDCKDSPYCDCGRINLEKIIFDLRTKEILSISQISQYLAEEYELLVFKGDLIDYLENLIYSLESIKNISEGIKHLPKNYLEDLSNIPSIIEKIKS